MGCQVPAQRPGASFRLVLPARLHCERTRAARGGGFLPAEPQLRPGGFNGLRPRCSTERAQGHCDKMLVNSAPYIRTVSLITSAFSYSQGAEGQLSSAALQEQRLSPGEQHRAAAGQGRVERGAAPGQRARHGTELLLETRLERGVIACGASSWTHTLWVPFRTVCHSVLNTYCNTNIGDRSAAQCTCFRVWNSLNAKGRKESFTKNIFNMFLPEFFTFPVT